MCKRRHRGLRALVYFPWAGELLAAARLRPWRDLELSLSSYPPDLGNHSHVILRSYTLSLKLTHYYPTIEDALPSQLKSVSTKSPPTRKCLPRKPRVLPSPSLQDLLHRHRSSITTAEHTRERMATEQAQEYRGTTEQEQEARDGHSADVEDPKGWYATEVV
jgi:hypothetical protein